MSRNRRRAERRGRWAESLASIWLSLKGYSLIAHRARTPAGELDIVAIKRGYLVIVEVKSRQTIAKARESITMHQRRRIARAAALYRARRSALLPLAIRYDQILFGAWQWPVHDRAAWIAEDSEVRDWL